MRLTSCLRAALLGGVLAAVSACSMIADWFPDKQKQYRYSSELPDLEIPPDLNASKIDGRDEETPSSAKGSQTASGKYSKYSADQDAGGYQAKPAKTDASNKTSGKKHKPVKHNDSSMTLAENMENAALIEMQEPYEEAWNDVGRALGRLKIEISDQNRSDGVFYVYYGGVPPKKQAEETSFWDDIGSVFSTQQDQAKEYRIKLEDKENVTNVFILDPDNKAVSEGPGLELLKRLHKKIITLDQPDTPDTDKGGDKAAEEKEKP